MGIAPLTVAAIAGGLLLVSVGFDLAFAQTLTLDAGKLGGAMQRIGETSFSQRDNYAGGSYDPIEVNRSDTIEFRARFVNEYPWPSMRAVTLSAEGCYDSGAPLATLDLAAPARGVGEASAQVSVEKLFNTTSRFSPKPVGNEAMPVSITLCRGDTGILYATLPLKEVPS